MSDSSFRTPSCRPIYPSVEARDDRLWAGEPRRRSRRDATAGSATLWRCAASSTSGAVRSAPSPAASGSGSPWPGCWRCGPACSSSTNRCRMLDPEGSVGAARRAHIAAVQGGTNGTGGRARHHLGTRACADRCLCSWRGEGHLYVRPGRTGPARPSRDATRMLAASSELSWRLHQVNRRPRGSGGAARPGHGGRHRRGGGPHRCNGRRQDQPAAHHRWTASPAGGQRGASPGRIAYYPRTRRRS